MLHIHRAERADRLADALAQTLIEPLDDPFTADVVAVPTRGIERWLAQRLSTRLGTAAGRADGVCANVEFPFPGRLVQGVLAAATGLDPADDAWPAERSVWPLLRTVDESLAESWLGTLAEHVAAPSVDGESTTRRFAVVRHLADLFERYGIQRPEMVRGWATGSGVGRADGDWQAELWRRLRARLGQPSPAERLDAACRHIREQHDALELPARLSLFGLTRIPRSHLDVLAAVAAHREVHLFVLHPSPALWDAVAETLQSDGPVLDRRGDPTADLAGNRLLASWGRDARELQLVLGAAGGPITERHHPMPDSGPDTLLGRIQADVRADRQPPGPPLPGVEDERPALAAQDDSIQIHACHGRARQVEVLRDALLHALEQDSSLEPRDIVVMCPDIETFAPLIHSTFGSAGMAVADELERRRGEDSEDDGEARLPDLRVRLADRSLRQTNPVLSVVAQLLELADQRATASQLLDLADRDAVRRRFRFDDDDLARMHDWVGQSAIRWGFDAEHRAPYGLTEVPSNTWRAGLDRILLGVTMTEDGRRRVGHVLPLDDVESGVIDLAGRMAEFVDRVEATVDALRTAKPIEAWVGVIADAADALTDASERDAWQRNELQRILDDVIGEADEPGDDREPIDLELADIRALLADRLRGRPTRANFRTGHLTVCTLVPMRSVPHRVVCVLGVDDGEFPRRAHRDGDDLLLLDPHVGDRDARSEDRQLLLDALMAATERLIITYTGNDERNNLPRPPAVPIGELMDIVDRTVQGAGSPAREAILIRQPLQPFDRRNFTRGGLVAGRPWGFDRTALGGARALDGPRSEPPPFLDEPLPPRAGEVIQLRDLVRFADHPIRAFLRGRLGIDIRRFGDEVADAMPVELDALERWGVGDRILQGLLDGLDGRACCLAEIARGSLPPGELGKRALAEEWPTIKAIAAAAEAHAEPPESVEVNLELPDGRRLSGTVSGVCGETIRSVSYSRVKPKARLGGWVRLLAVTAAHPERAWSSAVIGKGRRKGVEVTVALLPPLAADADLRGALAHELLGALIDIYDRGMREPLPLACATSAAYAHAAEQGEDRREAAGREWTSAFRIDREDRDPEHVLAFGHVLTIDELLAAEPRSDEQGPGWEAEPSRFGAYAIRLWRGLLAREEIRDQ